MALRIWPAIRPPPTASNANVAPVSCNAATRSAWNVGALESQTCTAPCSRRSAACSGRRTTLTSGTPSARQIRLSIWPRLDAAAVCTSPVCPSRRMVSTIPSAVSGFTNAEAPSTGSAPSGSGRHIRGEARQYSPYAAPPRKPTVRPSSACASGDAPAATTRPLPSLPAVIDWPTLAASTRMTGSAMAAVTVGSSADPLATASETSAIASSSARSDGLIGAASTRTSTSRSPGLGVSTVSSESRSSPSVVTTLRSWRMVAGISGMVVPSLEVDPREPRAQNDPLDTCPYRNMFDRRPVRRPTPRATREGGGHDS